MGRKFYSFYANSSESKNYTALIEMLNRDGLVTFDGISTEQDLLRLARAIGTIRFHRDSQKNGVTRISTIKLQNIQDSYMGFTSQELFPHTDGSSLPNPPQLVLLFCIKPADKGGSSIFVDGKKLYASLKKDYPEVLDTLSQPKSAFFTGSDSKCWSSIFSILPEGNICIRFRNDNWGYYSASTIPSLNIFVKVLKKYSFKLTLKPNQGYIVKNTRWLHGRTSFQGTRVMLRVLIDTNPNTIVENRINPGFKFVKS